MSQLDLNLLPLLRQDGQEPGAYPGIFMVTPPKRTSRGREDDRLVLYFTEQGNSPLGDDQTTKILGKLAQAYYKASGSVTSALRLTADVMNQFLLDRSLKSSNAGRQCIGLLALVVLRDQRLITGVCGPLRGWLITPQNTDEWFDPQASGRGLGLARAVSIRFFQAEYVPNSYLILAAQPPVAWTSANLQNAHSQGIESFRRRLLSNASDDISAVVIQPQPGTGKIRLLRVKPPAQMVKQADVAAASEPDKGAGVGEAKIPEETALPEQKVTVVPPAPIETLNVQQVETVSLAETEVVRPTPTTDSKSLEPARTAASVASTTEPPARSPITPGKPVYKQANLGIDSVSPQGKTASKEAKTPPKVRNFSLSPVIRIFTPIGKTIGNALSATGRGLGKLLKRILPDESIFSLPAATMAFIAIAIAVVIATAGIYVYWQKGRAAEYQKYYDLALQYAGTAIADQDPDEQRIAWETSIDYLDRAEDRLITQDSQTLRSNALAQLDAIDSIKRLNYEPALEGTLANDIVITKILVSGSNMFLLNENGGNVIRAEMTGRGYELDPYFDCGPNPIIGKIIDIIIKPRTSSDEPEFTLLGLDDRNQLVYCTPDESPTSNTPAAPYLGWIDPIGLVLDSSTLYILDAANAAVWYYEEMKIGDPPHLYFDEEFPKDINNFIDLFVNDSRLYLLHADGHVALCSSTDSVGALTHCTDPMLYDDQRPGRDDTATILDAHFSQFMYAPPPNPSIYMLDPIHQAVYHFSLQLTLQEQYRPLTPLGETDATAFTITSDRTILLAIGNKVFKASLP